MVNKSQTIRNIAIIATAIVTLTGGSGFSVYKWQQAELQDQKIELHELRQKQSEIEKLNSAQDILAGKDGHRLLDLEKGMEDLEDAVQTLTDSVGSMNVTINRMEVTLNFLADGL